MRYPEAFARCSHGGAGVVDACLIPEVSFVLHGEQGLLKYIEGVLQARGHAVICIAEGAGQARHTTCSQLHWSTQWSHACRKFSVVNNGYVCWGALSTPPSWLSFSFTCIACLVRMSSWAFSGNARVHPRHSSIMTLSYILRRTCWRQASTRVTRAATPSWWTAAYGCATRSRSTARTLTSSTLIPPT